MGFCWLLALGDWHWQSSAKQKNETIFIIFKWCIIIFPSKMLCWRRKANQVDWHLSPNASAAERRGRSTCKERRRAITSRVSGVIHHLTASSLFYEFGRCLRVQREKTRFFLNDLLRHLRRQRQVYASILIELKLLRNFIPQIIRWH